MTSRILAAAFVLIAFAPASAVAQSAKSAKQLRDKSREVEDSAKDDRDPDSSSASEEDPTPALPSSSAGQPSGRPTEAPGSEHRVEKGDTLWDLSQRYLGSPWYWPKVWSYNPEIANPHWIYPGNSVRFFNGGGEGPSRVEVGVAPTELPDVDEGEMVEEGDRVHVDGQIGFVPKKAITLAGTSFVTTREIEETGTIIGSFFEGEMLAERQPVYVRYANRRTPKLGELFVIYKNAGEITHPYTKNIIGYQTRILGQGKVTKVEPNGIATAVILKAYEPIDRGALIGPSGEALSHSVSLRPNDREIKDAYVVTATNTYLTVLAENQLIIIDKGADDGVKPGNTFIIWRQHDGLSQAAFLDPTMRDEEMPREDVGACMAFEVKSQATTCLLVSTIREIVRGDHVDMRPAGSGARSER